MLYFRFEETFFLLKFLVVSSFSQCSSVAYKYKKRLELSLSDRTFAPNTHRAQLIPSTRVEERVEKKHGQTGWEKRDRGKETVLLAYLIACY